MSLPYILTDMMARQGTEQSWRIIHDATHLSITILLPDTDPPSVKWVLPNGQQIDGNVLDADVSAGETLCLCGDFTRCGIDMTGCDPHTLRFRVTDMPITRGKVKLVSGRHGYLRDVRYNQPQTALIANGSSEKGFLAGSMKIIGSECHPSGMIFTVDELNQRRMQAAEPYWLSLEFGYVPRFTGDLGNLEIKFAYNYRKANADFTQCIYDPEKGAPFEQFNRMARLVIHHTGVHGHPDMSGALPGYYGFYGNPNMTPDDYDQIVIGYATNMQVYKDYQNSLQSFILDPAEFVLEISNRRTSASDAAVEQLRSLGCNVVEIEDE